MWFTIPDANGKSKKVYTSEIYTTHIDDMKRLLVISLFTLVTSTLMAQGGILGTEPDLQDYEVGQLMVYGGAYVRDDTHSLGTECKYERRTGYVYMVIDPVTETFMWLDCSSDEINERHSLYGSCRISQDTLYIQPKFGSIVDENGSRRFDDSTAMIYYYPTEPLQNTHDQDLRLKELFQNKNKLSEYVFLINDKELRDITSPHVSSKDPSKMHWVRLYRIKLKHRHPDADFYPIFLM